MVVAQNGHVFFEELTESRKLGQMEMITAVDNDNRYKLGVVLSAAEGVPLEEGDKFLYSWRDAFHVYAEDKMHFVVHFHKVIGKIK